MTEPTNSSDCEQDLPPGFQTADVLLLLPFAWQLGLAPWANGVDWQPMGLPFPMVWQMAGILFATAVLALRFMMDRKVEDRA